jgi:DNA primase
MTMTTAATRPRWDIGDILDRTDLAGLLDEYAEPAGPTSRRRWHCPMPDHHDNNPSVTMHIDGRGHQRWRCWSGDNTHRGDAIDLVMVARRVDRSDAIELLAGRAGLRTDEPLPVRRRRPTPAPPPGPVPLDPTVIAYVAACEKVLWSRTGGVVRDWLAQRGFDDDTIRVNRVGADPGRNLLRRAAGLPSGRSMAATFPALDENRQVAYVQTRYLQPTGDGPKYENPAARLGSNPRLAWTVPVGTVQPGTLIVCEGIPDALTAAQTGFRSVAVLGSQYPDGTVAERLTTHAQRDDLEIVAVVDADDAGRSWGERLGELLDRHGQLLRVVEPPGEGLDLNDWARQDPAWIDQTTSGPSVPVPVPVVERIDPVGSGPEVEVPYP